MQAFRDIVKGWFGKCVLALIVLLFVLLGSEALLSLAVKPKPAAVVNGEEISSEFLVSRIEQQKQSILQQYRGQITPDMIDEDLLKSSVLEGLINRILVREFLEDNALRVSQARVHQEVRSNSDFQAEGQFSQEQFSELVRRYDMTPAAYLDEVQFSLALESFQAALRSSAFVSEVQAQRLGKLESQRRAFKYGRISHEDFKADLQIEPAAVDEYYTQNLESYMESEAVKVDYVVFDESDVPAEQLKVEEADILTAYDAYVEETRLAERRESAHILIEVGSDRNEDEAQNLAESLLQEIRAGADFSELAKEHSDDLGSQAEGGSLGEAGRGDFVPEFEIVLFALNPGQVSEVVKTDFGFHIIKLISTNEQTPAPLEDHRSTLEAQVLASLREDAFIQLEEQVTELAFEMEDLEVFQAEFSKSVQTTSWITRQRGDGIFSTSAQITALFESAVVEEGRNTPWIVLDAQRGVVARLHTYRPEAPKPLADVKADIEQILLTHAASEQAMQKGQALIASLRNPGGSSKDSDSETVQETELSWESVSLVDRRSAQAPFNIIAEVFSMPKLPTAKLEVSAESVGPVLSGVKDGKEYVVIQLLAVEESAAEGVEAASEDSDPTRDDKQNALARAIAEQEFESLFGWLEAAASIDRAQSYKSNAL